MNLIFNPDGPLYVVTSLQHDAVVFASPKATDCWQYCRHHNYDDDCVFEVKPCTR